MLGRDNSVVALCAAATGLIEILNDRDIDLEDSDDIDLEDSDRSALLPALHEISEKIRSTPARSVADAAAKLRFVADNLDESDAPTDSLLTILKEVFGYLERQHVAQKE
jgi:hypothetical protein